MRPSPIAIKTDGAVSCAAVPWRFRGRQQLTIVVKAAFAIVPEDTAVLVGPARIVAEDRGFDGHPLHSVEAASDLAPYLARCDVLFKGHAYAPGGAAPAAAVRIGISREAGMLLDKHLHVFGDLSETGVPLPFTRIPIVYERAFGGSGQPNPVGSDTPNLIDPIDPSRPAGFGPISRFWPTRAGLLRAKTTGEATGPLARPINPATLEGPLAVIPEEMPWAYFQAAPPDQQIERLQGSEWIVLDGLQPTPARVQTRLPTARGVARVMVLEPGAPLGEHAVEVGCDTLAIDGDRQTLTLTWRSRFAVPGSDAPLPPLLIVAALETPGLPVDWDGLVERWLARKRPAPAGDAMESRTMAVRVEDLITAARALPFESGGASDRGPRGPMDTVPLDTFWSEAASGDAPSKAATVPNTAATPWSGEPLRPAPTVDLDDVTLEPQKSPVTRAAPPSDEPPPAWSTVVPPEETGEPRRSTLRPAATDPWAPAPPPPPEPPPPSRLPPPAFERPAAAAVRSSFYAKFFKK